MLQPTIDTQVSHHAARQAQRRGIASCTISLILECSDRSQKVSGNARALWISRKGRDRLIRSGLPVGEIDRASGVRLIVSIRDDVVITVEHMLARRLWA